jgi:hypothetical protein
VVQCFFACDFLPLWISFTAAKCPNWFDVWVDSAKLGVMEIAFGWNPALPQVTLRIKEVTHYLLLGWPEMFFVQPIPEAPKEVA